VQCRICDILSGRNQFNQLLVKRAIIFLYLQLATTMLSAQWGGAYLNRSSVWHFQASGGSGAGPFRSHYRYYLGADTLIGGQTYYKVFKQGLDSFWNAQGAFNYRNLYDQYAAALREDQFEHFLAVYPGQTAEKILFTFNYNPDLLQFLPTEANSGCNALQPPFIPSDILYLGSTPLRRWTLAGAGYRLIQGVGSEGGLLESGSLCTFIDANVQLICYFKDNRMLQVSSSLQCPQPAPSGPGDCEASFCYSAYDSASIRIVRYYNNSRLYLNNDSVIAVRMDYYNGQIGSILPSTILYPAPGTYKPSLTILTAKGCTGYFSTTILPGNSCAVQAVGSNANEATPVSVYPSVVRTQALFTAKPGSRGMQVLIYDASGRKLRTMPLSGGRAVLLRSGLAAGIYFYEVLEGGRRAGSGKLFFP
jgi:hypothetical protein